MLKKEVKRMEWGIAEVQPDQRAEAKYLLGIVDDEDDGDSKSVEPVEPKEEPKEEPKVEPEEKEEEKEKEKEKEKEEVEEEEDEEEDEEEVEETKKK